MDVGAINILITGLPGSGKTTLIRQLVEPLRFLQPVGFYTEEIREGSVRLGFRLIDLEGEVLTLSHINIHSRHRVGKYGVDIPGFEAYLTSRDFSASSGRIVIIDEIGKMECLSQEFMRMMSEILDSNKILLATIALRGFGIIDEIKRRHDVQLIELTVNNREVLGTEILKDIARLSTGLDIADH